MSYISLRISAPVFACCFFALSTGKTSAESLYDDANLCDMAAKSAAHAENVPLQILKAVARTESGKSIRGELKPWPWAINIEGKGVWLSSEVEALTLASKEEAIGSDNFDVGCFQLNYKWHGNHFSSLKQMFDPYGNALYAARFLKTLHMELGSWNAAVGAYHSRNQQFSKPYLVRFNNILSALNAPASENSTSMRKQNTFPLLRGTARSRTRGSLFPDVQNTPQHFFEAQDVRG